MVKVVEKNVAELIIIAIATLVLMSSCMSTSPHHACGITEDGLEALLHYDDYKPANALPAHLLQVIAALHEHQWVAHDRTPGVATAKVGSTAGTPLAGALAILA